MSTETHTHIVALGGGGFSEESDNHLIDDYILAFARSSRPRICFLPTASGDAQSYIEKFHASFPPARANASHLTVFSRCDVMDARAFLREQDVIYVGGGSTINLLAIWRAHGIDGMIRDAWLAGTVLAGISAGMVCWYEHFLTDSYIGGGLRPGFSGLGLLSGSACPHYDDPDRRAAFKAAIQARALAEGIGAEGCAALHYVDGALSEVVASHADRRAYEVRLSKDGVLEEPLEPRILE